MSAGSTQDAGQRFLEGVERSHGDLAKFLSPRTAGLVVDAILFARLGENRGVLAPGGLGALCDAPRVGPIRAYLHELNERFRGWPFGPAADEVLPSGAVRPLCALIELAASADVGAMGIATLGQRHERGLARHEKGTRKSHGVYYTPDHVVQFMVAETLGPLLGEVSGADAAGLRILDPACGSGSFLLVAYEYLLSWYEARAGTLTARERVDILENHLFGVDLDERAIAITKLSLALRALESSVDAPRAPACPRLDANIRRGNSLVDREFDYREAFPEAFDRGGFDVVLGNPPYVSYGGRQAVPLPPKIRRYFADHYESGGWSTAHSLFMERAAKTLSRRLVSFIVPDQVGHLAGYRPLRALLAREGRVTRVKYWGEDVFDGVVTPSLTFVFDKESSSETTLIVDADAFERPAVLAAGDPWTVSSSKALLDKLQRHSVSIRPWLADCGVRTTEAKKQVVALRSRNAVPVLEGKQIGRYSCAPPAVAVRFDLGSKVLKSRDEKYERAEFLIRQTAAYPIVGPREHATYFRNSLHALYAPDNGWDVRYVVGLLNSKLLRFAYVASVREAKQRAFPQVKLGPLGALPIRDLRLSVGEEKAQHDRIVALVAGILETKRALGATPGETNAPALRTRVAELDADIDAEVFRLYELSGDEIANVESKVAALAPPP